MCYDVFGGMLNLNSTDGAEVSFFKLQMAIGQFWSKFWLN